MSTASLLHTLGGCAIDITSHYQPSPCNDTDPTKRYWIEASHTVLMFK